MKPKPRKLQWSLSSFFVFVTLVAVLAPMAWDRYHSGYEISADLLGPLCDRSSSHTPRKAGDIKILIESQTEFGKKLVPRGSSNISAHVSMHDSYVEPAKLLLPGWTEHHHAIFRCEIMGLDLNGEQFSQIRFVDEHYYYILDNVESKPDLPHQEIVK